MPDDDSPAEELAALRAAVAEAEARLAAAELKAKAMAADQASSGGVSLAVDLGGLLGGYDSDAECEEEEEVAAVPTPSPDDAAATAAALAPGGLRPGSLVRIEGLRQAWHLNGLHGRALRLDPSSSGRWEVELLQSSNASSSMVCHSSGVRDEGVKMIRPENLVVILEESPKKAEPSALTSGSQVLISGLCKASHLNGHVGVVQGSDPGSGRLLVELQLGGGLTEVIAARPENLSPLTPQQPPAHVVASMAAEEPEDMGVDAADEVEDLQDINDKGDEEEDADEDEDEDGDGFEVGARVLIDGLKGAAHLNGKYGTLHAFDPVSGRWQVVVEDGDSEAAMAIKPENLTLAEVVRLSVGARVVLSGLKAAVHLNGKHGTLDTFDVASGRWQVLIDDDASEVAVAIKPDNLTLEVGAEPLDESDDLDGDGLEHGARVKIGGLKAAAHLNGKLGTLASFDVEAGRWQVLVDDDESGTAMAIKPDNLSLVNAASGAQTKVVDADFSAMGDNELSARLIEAELCEDAETIAEIRAILSGAENGQIVDAEMDVPCEAVGAIIGKGGEHIKRLSKETSVQMSFAKDDDENPPARAGIRILRMRGGQRAIAAAKRLVNAAVAAELKAKGRGKGKGGKQRLGGACYMSSEGAGEGAGGDVGVCKWFAAGFCRNRAQGGACRNGLHDAQACIRAEKSWISEAPLGGCAGPPLQKPLLLLLDLEGGGNTEGKDGEDEIIEVPVLAMCSKSGKELGRFHRFSRPGYWDREAETMRQRYRQEHFNTMSRAVPFPQVVQEVLEWLALLLQTSVRELCPEDFLFVTCGNWDVKTAMPRQCNKPVPGTVDVVVQELLFHRWCNLKEVFRDHYKLTQASAPTGMKGMLKRMRIPLSGQHHLGMDDVSNLAKILRTIVRDNGVIHPTGHAKVGLAAAASGGKRGRKAGGKGGGKAAKESKAQSGASTFVRASTQSCGLGTSGSVFTRAGGPFDFDGLLLAPSPQSGTSSPDMVPPKGPPQEPSRSGKRKGEDWGDGEPMEVDEELELMEQARKAKAAKIAGGAGLLAGVLPSSSLSGPARSCSPQSAPSRARTMDDESPSKLRRAAAPEPFPSDLGLADGKPVAEGRGASLSSLFAKLPPPRAAAM